MEVLAVLNIAGHQHYIDKEVKMLMHGIEMASVIRLRMQFVMMSEPGL